METHTPPSPISQIYLTWSAPEHPNHSRGKAWYIGAGILCAVLLAYTIYAHDWTFVLVLVIGAVLYGLVHRRSHPLHTITVGDAGILWDKRFIGWDECEGYWMLQGQGYVELHIELQNRTKTHLKVQTGEVPVSEIDVVFARFLPFLKDHREKVTDYIARIFKL